MLEAEWARAKRDDTSLSLLLIDVNHLKKFNDRCGRQAGDGYLHAIWSAAAATSGAVVAFEAVASRQARH